MAGKEPDTEAKPPAEIKKKPRLRVPKVVRNVLVSALVLLVVLVAAGVAYTYFNGQGPVQSAVSTNQAAPIADQPIKPSKPSPKAPESASVELLSSPVTPGGSASMSVKTLPESTCKVSLKYGSAAAADPGLAPQTADDFGEASWSWTVSTAAPKGSWPVSVTCAYNGKSAVVQGMLEVS